MEGKSKIAWPDEKSVEKKKVGETQVPTLNEFMSNTSIHGVKYVVAESPYKTRR